ncbi:MAG: sigma-54-dependent Fis family transcriptional regulator [Planctomycetes bacterium]|nr:sigma-54-dependent Fis family transcriptional regulator [Planctomycetota bacterium]
MVKKQRSPIGMLRKHVGDSSHPVLVFDADRVIDYCNEACGRWMGVAASALLGQTAAYHFETVRGGAPIASDVAPPPDVFEGHRVERRIQPIGPGAGGPRLATFLPLTTDGVIRGALMIADPVDAPPVRDRGEDVEEPESARLHRALAEFRRRLGKFYDLPSLVGRDPAIERVRAQVVASAATAARTLIHGPAGSGREQVARTIHYHRNGSEPGVLVPLACSLVDAELLHTTITAHAYADPEFDTSRPLTLLLLDVDRLSPDGQRALVDITHDRELRIHTLATAGQSVLRSASDGGFREDLAHYLSTIEIEMPPLRDRPRDIPLLAQRFVEMRNAEGLKSLSGFDEDALDQLVQYVWPGNLDELREVTREAYERAAGPYIRRTDLPSSFAAADRARKHPPRPIEPIRLDAVLERFEREILERALELAKGNRARAARLLGVSRPRLLRRIGQLALDGSKSDPPEPT